MYLAKSHGFTSIKNYLIENKLKETEKIWMNLKEDYACHIDPDLTKGVIKRQDN
jgi:hypothetical protein